MKCECEYLFCQKQSTTRVTVPHHKPRTLLCEEHTDSQLAWAQPYRAIIGAVSIERVQP